jgi:RNA polymerase sigma factor (sigma-70 family)
LGVGGVQGRLGARHGDADERVAAVMAAHGRALLRVAYRWSLCHDDAMDAYQRALEIFLRRIDTVDEATEVAWLKVVIKHEALAIRRSRTATVGADDVDPDQVVASPERGVDEKVASEERVKRSAEALRALKPDEARALMLKAEGLSYAEIGERCGWSYTKVNRAITEGRRRFLEVFRAIESGDACERYAGTLAALAGGRATSAEIIEVRPHLRHCMACRATVRELHMSRLSELQLWVPGALVGPLAWLSGGGGGGPIRFKGPDEILREAGTFHVPDAVATPAPAPAPPPPDLLDPAAIERAIDLGGSAVVPLDLHEHVGRFPRIGRIRDEAAALLSRSSSSDVAAGIHIASTGGGGRLATVATIIGFCFSSVGVGALCVATGVVEAPRWILHREVRPAPPPRSHPHARTRTGHTEVTRTPRVTELLRTPTPTPEPLKPAARRPSSRGSHRSASTDPSQGTAPDSHESAPIADTSRSSTPDFSIEQSGSNPSSTGDPAPATGGGEFTP